MSVRKCGRDSDAWVTRFPVAGVGGTAGKRGPHHPPEKPGSAGWRLGFILSGGCRACRVSRTCLCALRGCRVTAVFRGNPLIGAQQTPAQPAPGLRRLSQALSSSGACQGEQGTSKGSHTCPQGGLILEFSNHSYF